MRDLAIFRKLVVAPASMFDSAIPYELRQYAAAGLPVAQRLTMLNVLSKRILQILWASACSPGHGVEIRRSGDRFSFA